MTNVNVYSLLDRFGGEEVSAWMAGEETDNLGRLEDDEVEDLENLWPFWARPGQLWEPGPETITYWSAGRGAGKSLTLAHIICQAAEEPERWGGEVLVCGITPAKARELCEQDTGVIRVAHEWGYLKPRASWSLGRGELHFPHPKGGGRRGLHVRIASSSKPDSARGPNVGLLVADEWAFFHSTKDEQGLTLWEAAMNTLRVGEEKAIIVSSPSRKAEVREMRRRAEEPICEKGEPFFGCGARLPKSQRRKLSPLFSADTTEPERVCPECGARVVADVRMIRASTLDNRANLGSGYALRASRALASGAKQAQGEFGGEILDDDTSSPIPSVKVINLEGLEIAEGFDRYRAVWESLDIRRRIIAVDPATTAGPNSADTGLLALGVNGDEVRGLQDWSVPPSEVEGSPSRTWAPRAAIMVALWRATSAHVETNNGGLEVLDPLRRALSSLRASDLAPYLRDQHVIRAAVSAAHACKVEGISRKASKAARWDWAAIPCRLGEISLVRSPWQEPDHWERTIAHLTGYVPEDVAKDAGRKKAKDPIDRGDCLISGAQVLLGAKEVSSEQVVDPTRSPVYTGGLFRR